MRKKGWEGFGGKRGKGNTGILHFFWESIFEGSWMKILMRNFIFSNFEIEK
jgi:hypothetical protein